MISKQNPQAPLPSQGLKARSLLNRIEYQSNNFRQMVSGLRSSRLTDPSFQNDSEISKIEVKSDDLELDLELQLDQTVKRFENSSKTTRVRPPDTSRGDPTLRSKSRSPGAHHRQFVIHHLQKNQPESHAANNSSQQIRWSPHIQKASKESQPTNNESQPSNNHQIASKAKASQFRIKTSKINTEVQHKNQEKLVEEIEHLNPQRLMNNLPRRQPVADSNADEIFEFFDMIYSEQSLPKIKNPLIKRYKNCVYFGQKVPKEGELYIGMVWYYRKAIYFGQFRQGRKHGKGVEIDQSGQQSIWRGNFQNGRKTGHFEVKTKQSVYRGMLLNGRQHGQGTLQTSQSIYTGNFKDGLKSGWGKEQFSSGSHYIGDYNEGKFHGKGELTMKGYYYKGCFVEGKAQGFGAQRSGEYEYTGDFKAGLKHGKGVLTCKGQFEVEGEFKHGQIIRETSNRGVLESQVGTPLRKQQVLLQNYLSKDLYALDEENECTSEADSHRYIDVANSEEQPLQMKIFHE